MTDTKPRTIHYKRAVFSDGTENLEALVRAALNSGASVVEGRREMFTSDANVFRLINQTRDYSGMIFGEFITSEPGKRQPLLDLSDGSSTFYPLEAQEPEANKAFAEDVFYFGVKDNDLVIAQTRAMRAREFETHLVWLLTECSSHMNPETTMLIQDQPGPDIYQRVANTEAKAIKVGTPLAASRRIDESEEGLNLQSSRFNLSGLGASVIRAAIGDSAFESLDFSEDLDEANLKVVLLLSYSRKTTNEGQRALDELASSFRHIEGMDYELKLKNGGVVKGEDMKISKRINVVFRDSGLPDLNDLYKQMHDWLMLNLLSQLNSE